MTFVATSEAVLAAKTAYWEPALWSLIVVAAVGVLGSALWAPPRGGRKRQRSNPFRRSAKRRPARVDERRIVGGASVVTRVPGAPSPAPSVPAVSPAHARSHEIHPTKPVPVAPEPERFVPAQGSIEPESTPVEPVPVVAERVLEAPVHDVAEFAEPVADEPMPVVAEPVAEESVPAAPMPAVASHEPVRSLVSAVTGTEVDSGLEQLDIEVAAFARDLAWFMERSAIPAEMPTWPLEHQVALADQAAVALAEPLDGLLEHAVAVASSISDLDRIIGRRSLGARLADDVAMVVDEIAALRPDLGMIRSRFQELADRLPALAGTSDQVRMLSTIVDTTLGVAGRWEGVDVGLGVPSAVGH